MLERVVSATPGARLAGLVEGMKEQRTPPQVLGKPPPICEVGPRRPRCLRQEQRQETSLGTNADHDDHPSDLRPFLHFLLRGHHHAGRTKVLEGVTA
jgi:hypothetical protein